MNDASGKNIDPVWACILIGGKSSRMGRDKHLIQQDGISWLERTVSILRTVSEQVVVVGQGNLPESLSHSITRVDDIAGLAGPLAGILAVLRYNPHVSWLVAACDLPAMHIKALQWILKQRESGTLAVMPDLQGNGQVEPLLAYYDRRCRILLEELAADGQLQINVLKTSAGVKIPQPPAWMRNAWFNVNSPEDLQKFTATEVTSYLEKIPASHLKRSLEVDGK